MVLLTSFSPPIPLLTILCFSFLQSHLSSFSISPSFPPHRCPHPLSCAFYFLSHIRPLSPSYLRSFHPHRSLRASSIFSLPFFFYFGTRNEINFGSAGGKPQRKPRQADDRAEERSGSRRRLKTERNLLRAEKRGGSAWKRAATVIE